MTRACIRSIKSRLKKPKLPKYEGICALRCQSDIRCGSGFKSPLNFLFDEVKALLILGNQFFSDMFTSYSHAPAFRPLPRA